MQFGEKPLRCLFRRRWKQPELPDFVRFGIDSTVQPVIVTIDADHFFVDRELIRTDS